MRKTILFLLLPAFAALVCASGADAATQTARIHYAEPVTLKGLPSLPASGPRKPASSARTSFDAFGHRFELALESNDRVLRKLASADRDALPTHALYQGTVVGLPGSWVRLTRLADGIHGLVFDGAELYVLAPSGSTQAQLDTPLPGLARTATVIYRAADTESGLGPDFCRVLEPPHGGTTQAAQAVEPAYKTIFAELKSSADAIAAALPGKELDLALIGDTQLAGQYSGNTAGEMLARLNNIDGIFSAQVGVRVTSGFVKVLTDNVGMTSTAADQLLDQFESYRRVTPEAASRGLSHLMTGRELDGSTIGIAYISTLCASQFAVSLSQTYVDSFYSSLVAAHEVGHNFGAPHDGTSGSACATTPQTFLMSPSINGSSTFSQCSRDQMAPVVSGATCLTIPSFADVSVEIASTSISGYTNQDVHVPVDVVSNGTVSASQTVLRLSSNGFATIASATVAGGTCTSTGCQLGTLAAGVRKQVDVVVRASSPGSGEIQASVTASGDIDAGNNNDGLSLIFATPADGSITASPTAMTAQVGQTQSFAITASNAGPLALEGASIVIQRPIAFEIVSAGGTGAVCSTSSGTMTCTLGSVPAGETRRVDVSTRATTATIGDFHLILNSANDSANGNNTATVRFTALPNVELTLSAVSGTTTVPIGGTIKRSFVLSSVGPQPVSGATFTVSTGNEIDIVSASGSGAVCTADAGTTHVYRCSYASAIESGGSRQVDVVLRGQTVGPSWVSGFIAAPDSQHLPGGNSDMVSVNLSVQSLVDVRIEHTPAAASAFDHRAVTLPFDMTSVGATPAANSRFTLTLPANVRATAAQSATGTCSITTSTVACAIGTMATGATNRVQVTLVSDVVGQYTPTLTATADGDTQAGNDSYSFNFFVQSNTDVAVGALPAGVHVRQGSSVDYAVSVTAATQPVPGVVAVIAPDDGLVAVQATPSQGTCALNLGRYTCSLGTLPAGGSATITVKLRGDIVGSHAVNVSATADSDVDPSNGLGSSTIVVDQRGDVALQAAASSTTATVGTPFDYPRITLNAIAATDDVRFAMTVPAAFTVDSATADGAACSVNAGNIACAFGTLSAGTSRGIAIRLRPNQSGSFPINANATAADDADTGNNSASVTVAVNKAASSGGGGSGGGGGALDRESLLLMLLLAPILVRRRSAGAR